jgi:poly-gamma-glutamate capsule biosynthesis protein CapA/YwtB (metallophosphatase superfamily)
MIANNDLKEYKLNLCNDSSPVVRILVAGDLYCGGRTEGYLVSKEIDVLWGDIRDELINHDLRMVNLENPLTDSQSTIFKVGPHLRASPECAVGIISGGFNIVTLANNHMKDMGDSGVIDTIRHCQKAGLYTVGAGTNLETATQPLKIEVNGIRISILAIAEGEFSVAEEDSPGVWPLDLVDNYYQIRKARESSDIVLVIFHGGVEFYSLPTPDMVKTCRFFLDAGANCVVCHHIHIPSGFEIYNNAPIFYSTGNFLFDWKSEMPPEGYTGYLISLEISPQGVNNFRLIPYFQYKDEFGVRRMKNPNLNDFLQQISKLSAIIQDKMSLNKEFKKFVESKREHYLTKAMMLTRLERKLFSRGIWPFWRTNDIRLARLKNQFACRAHYYMMVSILEEELNRLGKI